LGFGCVLPRVSHRGRPLSAVAERRVVEVIFIVLVSEGVFDYAGRNAGVATSFGALGGLPGRSWNVLRVGR